jgi:hypothetical protein
MVGDAAVEYAEKETRAEDDETAPDANSCCLMLKSMFGKMDPAEIERVRAWVAAGEYGQDIEIGLGENDTDRPVAAMPKSAMDAAIRMTPELARIGIGAPGSYSLDGRGRGSGSLSTKTIAQAEKIAPGLSTIGYGAI